MLLAMLMPNAIGPGLAFASCRRALSALVLLLVFYAAAHAQEAAAVRVALVIGNSSYQAVPVADALRDAKAVSETLRARGFTVIDVRDASLEQMRAALARAGASLAGQHGIGMLYYTGHGVQFNWHNYLIPIDARIATPLDIASEALDVQEIIDAFKAAGNRMNIVILDACRDGPFTGFASGQGLAQVDAPPGTFLAFAAAPGSVVPTSGMTRGDLYAGLLVEELSRPGIKLEDAFKRARRRVRQQSEGRQTPWESTSLEENFFLDPDGQARPIATREYPNGKPTEVSRVPLERESNAARPAGAMPEEFIADNTRFVGHFVKDPGNKSYSGNGRISWPNGDIYEGTVVTGKRDGKGSFVWPTGQRYTGDWRGDLPNGTGIMEFVDGGRYEGVIGDGLPDGPGLYTWSDGRRLEGTWSRGKLGGIGDLRFANGDIYHGELVDGTPNGSGRVTYASGDHYVGSFKDGFPDGEGTCTWLKGDKFTGRWRRGLKEGPGVMTWANGDRWEGIYRDDKPAEGQVIRKKVDAAAPDRRP